MEPTTTAPSITDVMAKATDLLKDKSALESLNRTVICFSRTIYRSNGVWEGANPLVPILPMFLFQLTVAITTIRLLLYISGILLGPTGIGSINKFRNAVFPTYSLLVVEPMAHLALVYYAFLMGLEMDIRALPRTGTKSIRLAISGTIIPLITAFCICSFFKSDNDLGWIYGGLGLAVTGFQVLAPILEKHNLIHTDIGKIALSSALLSEFFSWVLLAVALAISNKGVLGVFMSFVLTFAAILGCIYGVRRLLVWVIRKSPEGQGYSEYYLCSILAGVALVGVLMDATGTHPMIGAFVFGLIIPNTMLEATLLDRLEDFIHGIFMPLFFVICGLRTNVEDATAGNSYFMVFLLIAAACFAKVLSAVCVAGLNNMKMKETLAIGFLTNTKSAMALIILEIGQEQRALSTQTYSALVISILIMTMVVSPIITYQNPASKNVEPYKRKTIQKPKGDEELRVLACIHGMQNVPAILRLLDTSHATRSSPLSVFVVQLVEHVGRAAATLVLHSARKVGPRNPTHTEAQTEQIITALDNFELQHDFITIQAMTSKSAYATMDEDICSIAKNNRAALIVLPFHKIQTLDGEMEDINPSIRSVNENVLSNAPCSVAILIDRGLAEFEEPTRRIAMLFFGGPDDREALSYCWRMSEQEEVILKVIRFIPNPDAMKKEPLERQERGADVMLDVDIQREQNLDKEFVDKFKAAAANSESISYSELVLNDEEEMIRAIKSMDGQNELYVVGKGRGMVSPLTAELTDWCDCPELGAIGDLLVTSEFESAFAVLVVQQYVKTAVGKEESERSIRSMDWWVLQQGD